MMNKKEYEPISWQKDVDQYFNVGEFEKLTTFDLNSVEVTGRERLENDTMADNTIYFYYGTQNDHYIGLRCAIKNAKGEVIRLGLAATLKLAASQPEYASLEESAKASVGKKSGLSEDEQEKLFKLIRWTAKHSSKNDNNQPDNYRLTILNDQYDFLRDEFKAALEVRHQANENLHPLPGGLTPKEWHKKCDEFYAAGLKLWEATHRKNLPDHFHKKEFFGDPDGSKIDLINQVLERARRELEFMPDDFNVPDKVNAHLSNLQEIETLSQQVLGHSNLKMIKIGAILLLMSAVLVGMVFCPPAVLALPLLGPLVGIVLSSMSMMPSSATFTLSAIFALSGLYLVGTTPHKTISSATSNYKQAVKDINKDMNKDLKNAYEVIDKNTPLLAKLFK